METTVLLVMTAALAFLQNGERRKQIEALGLMVGEDGNDPIQELVKVTWKLMKILLGERIAS